MVTVFLRGGLGNQMFQYALGFNLAKKNNTQLFLDTTHLGDRTPRRNFTYRNFDLDIFMLEPTLTLLSRFQKVLPIPLLWLGLDVGIMELGGILGVQTVIHEKNDRFDSAVLGAQGNLYLYGRWQSEKYFANIANDVRAEFRFRSPLAGEAKILGEKIRATNAVSLHVRRGDYAAMKNVAAVMGGTDLEYYSRAAAHIGEREKEPHFFIFSDDIAWCEKNIKLQFPMTYVSGASGGPKASYHLQLMSLCKHNIIANSTFSWWGAWLNANPEKIVVAPKKWFVGGGFDGGDIIPERWVRI